MDDNQRRREVAQYEAGKQAGYNEASVDSSQEVQKQNTTPKGSSPYSKKWYNKK